MNWAHVHLIINHIPVIGIPVAVLLLVYPLIKKSEEMKMVSFGLFASIVLVTRAVYFTGGAAKKVFKNLPGVTEAYISRHEEIASLTLILMEMMGITSLAGFVFLRRSSAIPKWVVAIVLVLSFITAAATSLTANLSGRIRHAEIRDDVGSRAGPCSG
jgi:hypothetical protein